MISFVKIFFLLACLLLPTYALTEDKQSVDQINFVAAEKALRNNHMAQYKELKSKLENSDYVLKPYLDYAEIQTQLAQNKIPTEKVRDFLKSEHDSSLGDRLRSAWLYHLAKKSQWALFLEDYRPNHDLGLRCNEIYARYKINNNAAALNDASPLWLNGKSQPEACNRVFDVWRKEGGLTETLTWQRIHLAMDANQYAIVNYLMRYIPKEKQYLVQAWLTTYRDPKIITSDKLFSGTDPFLRDVQIYGITRIARREPTKAANLWDKLDKKHTFSEAQRFTAYRSIATNLAMAHDPEALNWFKKVPFSAYDNTSFEWHTRAALRQSDWQQVAFVIGQFPGSLRQDSAWQYWLARAYEQTGKTSQATTIYRQLTKDRTFAGMLASDRLGIPYPLNLPKVRVNVQDMEDIVKNKGIARALALHELGRLSYANREWMDTIARLSEVELQAAAILAYENDWQERAILTLSRAENQNNLEIRFPVLYHKTIQREAKNNGLNQAWVFAIARRESAFVQDARSPVGASGLMQLMPLTAKQVAKKIKEPYTSPTQLTKPSLNIRLGSAYLGQMYKSYDNNVVLATAAYNAGPYRVKQWLPKTGSIPADIWIETVPFHETREYVKAVLVYKMIYQKHLGMDQRLEEFLGDGVGAAS